MAIHLHRRPSRSAQKKLMQIKVGFRPFVALVLINPTPLGQYYVMLPDTSGSRLPQIVPGPGARGSSGTMAAVYSNDIVLGGSNRIQNQRLPTVSPIVSRRACLCVFVRALVCYLNHLNHQSYARLIFGT